MLATLRRVWRPRAALQASTALPAVLLVLGALFTILKPVFLSQENLISIVHQVAIIGIMAFGMTFVVMTGGIDLSIGPVLAVAGVLAAEVLDKTADSVALATAAAIALSGAIGLVNGVLVARLKLPPIVVTLATLSIVRGGALLMAGPDLHLIRGPRAFLFIGSGTVAGLPFSVLLFLVGAAFFTFLQYRTRFGLSVTAVGDNERAAHLSGLTVARVKTIAYILCSCCAGLAGLIQSSQVHTATATYGMGIELDVIAAVVLGVTSLAGGSGAIPLTIAGVMLIGIIDNGLGLLNVPIEMQLIAKGSIIIGALAITNRDLVLEH
ncbi:MAG: ABC transporter permease [Methylobacteriaceae bacterium]|nr:ABC transporter permease [Methylobacteriaceae bacterium]